MPEHAITYGSAVVMDPGAAEVREHVVSVIRDLVRRYDVDGVHFDDYFYPYPADGHSFDDAATYAAYRESGGALALADWRRDNVNQLIAAAARAITDAKPWVRFGVSPFGIYRPGMPEGITGLDAYATLYSDPLVWLREGWVDYLAPQLYWPTTQSAQAYGALLAWWADRAHEHGRYLFAGNTLARLGTSDAWTAAEIEEQIRLGRTRSESASRGNVLFRAQMLQANTAGVADVLRERIYVAPALPPPLATAPHGRPAAPRVSLGSGVVLAHDDLSSLRGFTVYRIEASGAVLDRFVPRTTTTLELAPGRWAIAAVDRFDRESEAAAVQIP
jgi:uncharacterized lipoprotein YddW (UPF0748 family)